MFLSYSRGRDIPQEQQQQGPFSRVGSKSRNLYGSSRSFCLMTKQRKCGSWLHTYVHSDPLKWSIVPSRIITRWLYGLYLAHISRYTPPLYDLIIFYLEEEEEERASKSFTIDGRRRTLFRKACYCYVFGWPAVGPFRPTKQTVRLSTHDDVVSERERERQQEKEKNSNHIAARHLAERL